MCGFFVAEFMPSEFLVRYNTLILCQDMLRTINVIECIIRLIERGFGGFMPAHPPNLN